MICNGKSPTLSPMFGRDPKELQKLIDATMNEGGSIEDVEKQIGKLIVQPGRPEEFQKIKETLQKSQNEFKEQLKDLEPYELSEIKKIYNEAITSSRKVKERELVLKRLAVALEKIGLIINNAKAGYECLKNEGALDVDPVDFWNQVYQAENCRKQIDIKIWELQLVEPKESGITDEPEPRKGPLIDKTSIAEPKVYREVMNVEEVAEYLGRKKSTIYHMVSDKRIPYVKHPGSSTVRFLKSEIDEWLKTGKMPNREGSLPVVKKQYRFSFKVPLKQFSNLFVERHYLTDKNANLFAARFQNGHLIDDYVDKIDWEKSLLSLMTFLLVSDKLGLIDMDDSDRRPSPAFGDEFIPFEPFFSNFNIKKGGDSGTSITNKKGYVLDALEDIRLRTERLIHKESPPLEDILDAFFSHKHEIEPTLDTKKKKGIDFTMLEITYNMKKSQKAVHKTSPK